MQNISLNILPCIQNSTVQLKRGKIVPCSFAEKIKRYFSSSHDKNEIQAVADHIFNEIRNSENPNSFLPIANAFVIRYAETRNGEKISQIFDRKVGAISPDHKLLHNANQSRIKKWQRYGQDPLIYQRHPEFCNFMETSGLLSQIKVTQDAFQEIDGEAAIKVNSQWMKWSDFKNQFEAVFSERYNETFIVHTDNQVFTYLDNGKGLQPHHPFLTENTPTSVINDEDYTKVLLKARTFIRKGEEDLNPAELDKRNLERTFILQLVTSHAKGADTRFTNLLTKPQHPYVRLVVGHDNPSLNIAKGEVYEVGYVRKSNVTVPLTTTDGRFRSPDINEYLSFEEKVVTNIAVTPKEAQAFVHYVSDYHRGEVNIGNPIGFHLLKQNCTTFARASLEAANIQIPTEITLSELVRKIAPVWIATSCGFIKSIAAKTHSLAKRTIQILPSWIKNPINRIAKKIKEVFHKILEALTAVVFIPLKLALGDAFGTGGRAFTQVGDQPQNIEPSLKSFKRWFLLSSYKVNLAGILQNWQREQASTVIYKNPVKLCIVP
ncbi:MAG TPA: hypothetical protein VGP47_05920 [Parachlamydiaceae bacterium]|nr:hypothetical protein [Parachlamydiaceae bacterium]